ncbi:hypothetical protein SAMN05421541_14029 [Actinoplanes philippinensis]|uniref:Uncharacterized protein n=1 Tax=Actinoplanes philippinensis TaxID=35752 RepID=A0A1I2N851_9ACTN|nr:hypothetical protein SAMN05421541_14029 [Actinoplanes philippinensis]
MILSAGRPPPAWPSPVIRSSISMPGRAGLPDDQMIWFGGRAGLPDIR